MRTKRIENTTVTVCVNEDLKEDYTSTLDGSINDDIRSHMEEAIRTTQNESDNNLLDGEILRDGYLALRRTAEVYDPNGHRIDVTTTISRVAERAETPKDTARRHVLKSLIRDGYAKLG